jgi:hypothetical protein
VSHLVTSDEGTLHKQTRRQAVLPHTTGLGAQGPTCAGAQGCGDLTREPRRAQGHNTQGPTRRSAALPRDARRACGPTDRDACGHGEQVRCCPVACGDQEREETGKIDSCDSNLRIDFDST